MAPEEKIRREVCWVLNKIQEEFLINQPSKILTVTPPESTKVSGDEATPDWSRQKALVRKLAAEKFIKATYSDGVGVLTYTGNKVPLFKGFTIETNQAKLNKACKKYECDQEVLSSTEPVFTDNGQKDILPKEFILAIRGKEIMVNKYLIARLNSFGTPSELIRHIVTLSANTTLTREELPYSLKNQVGTRSLQRILASCGFKMQIRKMFFEELGQRALTFRGQRVTLESLKTTDIDLILLIKELESADMRNRKRIGR